LPGVGAVLEGVHVAGGCACAGTPSASAGRLGCGWTSRA
jgi:hypothetical protein